MVAFIGLGSTPPPVPMPSGPATPAFPMRADLLVRPSDTEIRSMELRIGSRINHDYENGKMTPTQKKKMIVFTAAAVCTIFAIGAIVAACTIAFPIGFAAIALGATAIGLAIYAATRKDLDSPKQRQEIMRSIARKSLENIARDYKRDHLVDYALLDRAFPVAASNPVERAVAYAQFEKLREELDRAKSWRQDVKEQARSTYHAATGAFRGWYNDQKFKIAQSRDMRDLHRENAQMRRAMAPPHKPTTGERLLRGVAAGAAVVSEIALQEMERNIERQYGVAMGPWDSWLAERERAIQSAYNHNAGILLQQFATIK